MMRLVVVVAALALIGATPAGTIQLQPDSMAWTPGSATMPPGTQVAVLEGDPKAARFFTIRLKVPAGSKLAPHWHPRDERVTVISGWVAIGFGETIDEQAITRLGPGAFYVNPANSRHYVSFIEDSVVQVTGIGPWEVNFISAPAR